MATAKGSKVLAAMGEESTYATAAPGQYLQLPITKFSGGLKRTSNGSAVLRGDRNPTRGFLGRQVVQFDIVMQPSARDFAFIMKHALGAFSVSGAGPYTHTLKVSTLPVGLTVDKFFQDLTQIERYTGCRIQGFEFSCNDDGLLEVTVHFIGSLETDAVALIDVAPKLYQIAPMAIPKLTINEGGAGTTIGKNFHLTFMNNLDVATGQVMGNNGAVNDLPEGIVSVEFDFQALFQSVTLLNKAKAETVSSISLTFPSTAVAGHSISFAMNELNYHVDEPGVEGPNGIIVPLKGRAFYDADAAASALVCTIINDISLLTSIPA